MHLISSEQDTLAEFGCKHLLNDHFRPLFIDNEGPTILRGPFWVQIDQIGQQARMLAIGAHLAVNQRVAVGVSVYLELASLVIVQVLLLYLCHFKA